MGRLGRRLVREACETRCAVVECREHHARGKAGGLGGKHALGAHESRKAGKDHLRDPKPRGDGAGMLSARAAEGDERVVSRIDAVAHAERLDGKRHARVGDVEECLQQRVARRRPRAGELASEFLEGAFGRRSVQAHRADPDRHAAREQIDIGDGQRPAAAVARRAWIGARAFGSDSKRTVAHAADGASTCRDAVDRHARRCDRHAIDARFAAQRHLVARGARHIGACAAHVETHGAADPVAPRHGADGARATRRT